MHIHTKMLECYNFRKVLPDNIRSNTEKLVAQQRAAYDKIGSIPLTDVSYANVIKVNCSFLLMDLEMYL